MHLSSSSSSSSSLWFLALTCTVLLGAVAVSVAGTTSFVVPNVIIPPSSQTLWTAPSQPSYHKPLVIRGIRVTYTGWVEVDVYNDGHNTLHNLRVYGFHSPGNETRATRINVLPAGEQTTVALPHPVFQLSFPCNLFGIVVEKRNEHSYGYKHASNGHATYTRAIFRVCQLSNKRLQPAVRETNCSSQCEDSHEHAGWFHCCSASLHKKCAVACCKTEQRHIEVPQCCVVQRNRSEVLDFVDHFRSVSYRNSNGDSDWRDHPWRERPAFLPFKKLMGDDNPRTPRIYVSEEEESALTMQCGTEDCSAGCIFSVDMFVHRRLLVPACSGEGEINISFEVTYHVEDYITENDPSRDATFTLFTLDGTVIHRIPIAADLGATTTFTFDVSTTTTTDPRDTVYLVEFHVPVVGCARHSKRSLTFKLHTISIQAKCDEFDVECPARTDACGTRSTPPPQ